MQSPRSTSPVFSRPAAPIATDEPKPEEQRFVLVGSIGEGGMGKVMAFRDTALDRKVAVKIAHPDPDDPDVSETLLREARLAGALEHPNIIPVYDVGRDPAWGAFYVMRIVEQPTLEDALDELRKGGSDRSHGRLLRLFIQVCQAVGYAHSRGVVHCDLKPENVLLGSFGEVFVADWGLSHRMGVDTTPPGGTAGFMPPEQLRRIPEDVDGRTDVFALGAILYQILTDERPFPAVTFDAWDEAELRGRLAMVPPSPPSVRAPGRSIPPELEEICLRAIELERDRRPTALEMAAALDAFLEGTKAKKRKLRRAEELTRSGDDFAESHRDLGASRLERLGDLAALRASVPAWETEDKKAELWDAEDREAVLDSLGARTFQAAISAYEHALDEVPDFPQARRGLARLYSTEYQRALDERDGFERARLEALALEYDDGTLADTLKKGGRLTVDCPGGAAEVALVELAERAGRLVPARERLRGAAPLGPIPLEAGSYGVVVLRGDAPEIRFPALIRAGRDHVIEVDLATLPIGDGMVPIPGGPALIGGHESNPWARERREIDVPAFAIARFPVSFAEYLGFVEALYRGGDAQAAEERLPRTDDGDPWWQWTGAGFAPAKIARWKLTDTVARSLPAFGIPIASAAAYAAWRAAKAGKKLRLPSEWEWEKAARGVDGRPYPWGSRFDATFCKMRESRPGMPAPEAIGAFALDESPYGVRDLAGGVAEWVTPSNEGERAGAIAKGGAFCDWAIDCHAAGRRVYLPEERSGRVGFRLACAFGA